MAARLVAHGAPLARGWRLSDAVSSGVDVGRKAALLRGVGLYAVGMLFSRFAGFLMLPFYTAVLSKQAYGYVDLVLTGSTLFGTLVTLRLFDAVYRALFDETDPERRAAMITSVLGLVTINALAGAALVWGLLALFGIPLPHPWLLLAWTLLRIPAEFFQQTTRVVGDRSAYAGSAMVNAATMAVSSLLLLGVWKLEAAGYVGAMALGAAAMLAYLMCKDTGARFVKPRLFSLAILRPMLAYALPLVPAAISWWVIRMIGRYTLGHSHGLQEVADFAVSDKLPAVVYMLNITFYMAWQDAVLRHARDSDRVAFYRQALGAYVRLGLVALGLIAVFLRPFFALMIDAGYAHARVYVPPLLLSAFLLCVAGLYDVLYQLQRRTSAIFGTSLLAALLAAVMSWLLVPVHGVWGTVAATISAAAVLAAIRGIDQYRAQGVMLPARDVAVGVLFFVLGWMVNTVPDPRAYWAAAAAVTVAAVGSQHRLLRAAWRHWRAGRQAGP
ncbi:hypothetical protein CDN99_03740 [Roseateles aquatilis]|uniref:Polysaccharide biosynthesis protein C-terminal domain-containing protein n=1 Tax=Roseateles aquatilis TaxID=431061 RepID=A0A246JLQ6_9BURK|nr:lipopolysaccharide biosynthesis protein [Roseateles aquatilis]OWQ93584.1 hypothetical protein CDN99_03740 [Roseateles aquatilis]